MTPIQRKIEEYRKWLNSASSHMLCDYSLDKFNELFPEDTQTLSDHLDKIPGTHEPTMSDLIMDTVDIPVDDGPTEEAWRKSMDGPTLQQKIDMMQGNLTDYPDETDSLYPKTQPHSFPPRD